jgi:hypothetical protein
MENVICLHHRNKFIFFLERPAGVLHIILLINEKKFSLLSKEDLSLFLVCYAECAYGHYLLKLIIKAS